MKREGPFSENIRITVDIPPATAGGIGDHICFTGSGMNGLIELWLRDELGKVKEDYRGVLYVDDGKGDAK